MMPNISEIILILIILALVFGIGKLGNLSAAARQVKNNFQKGLDGGDRDEPIDITPRDEAEPAKSSTPKPGTKHPGVQDAEIEET
jgi:Sec-independent protein translocase protein TatA